MTLPEVLLWRELKGRRLDGLQFRRQHPIGPYVLDFFCAEASLAVEVDGLGHGADGQPTLDARRDTWLAEMGVRTLRVSASEVLRDPAAVARMVLEDVHGGSPLSQLR